MKKSREKNFELAKSDSLLRYPFKMQWCLMSLDTLVTLDTMGAEFGRFVTTVTRMTCDKGGVVKNYFLPCHCCTLDTLVTLDTIRGIDARP